MKSTESSPAGETPEQARFRDYRENVEVGFRWKAALALWTMLAGPVFDNASNTRRGPVSAPTAQKQTPAKNVNAVPPVHRPK